MKLTKLQQHYNTYFKEQYKGFKYTNLRGLNHFNTPSAVLKKVLKQYDMKLINSYSFDKHKPSPMSEPHRIEISFVVNNVPYLFSILAKSRYFSCNMNMTASDIHCYKCYPEHFAVSYHKNIFHMWETDAQTHRTNDKINDYKDIVLNNLPEEELFQQSLVHKNIHIHKAMTQGINELTKIQNFSTIHIITVLNEVKECLKKLQLY